MLRSPWTCNVSSIHQRSIPVVANFIKKQVQVKSEQLIIQKLNASSHLWEAKPGQARPGHGILAPPIQQSRRICLSSLFTPFFLHLQHQQQQPWPWQVASRNTSSDTQRCARAVPTCCLVVCSCLRFRPNFGRHHPLPLRMFSLSCCLFIRRRKESSALLLLLLLLLLFLVV